MKVVTFKVNQDWQAEWPEDGSIWEFLGKDYDMDTKLTNCVFKLIGNPVDKKASTEVVWS